MHTPLELYGNVHVKREDRYLHPSGARGAKARALDGVFCAMAAAGTKGVAVGVARTSSIPAVVAVVARHYGMVAAIHTAAGRTGGEEFVAARAAGATVHEHRPGYQSVIAARVAAQAATPGWATVQLGLEHPLALAAVAAEAATCPLPDYNRLVVTVGSGMMLASILHGLARRGINKPVVGVCVGQDPVARLDRHAPPGWRGMVTLVPPATPFNRPAPLFGRLPLRLDPYYEGKAAPHVRDGDLFWVVALRSTLCR